jgi:hypothetical protein
MFIQLTSAENGNLVVVFFGTGGAIKAERFTDDNTTELYNAEGNCVAKVKEDIQQLQMAGLR